MKTNGTLACWGDNGSGQATPPRAGSRRQRRQRPQLRRQDQRHARLLGRQRRRRGEPARGHLHGGHAPASTTAARSRPTARSPAGATTAPASRARPRARFTAVSAGWFHTCGVKTDGRAACWGADPDGEATRRPGQLFSGPAVTTGNAHTCGVEQGGGAVVCWGDNDYGQSTPPAGAFTAVGGGGSPHLRDQDERHPRLLGLQRLRAGDAARRAPSRRRRRALPQLRVSGPNGTLACWGRNNLRPGDPAQRQLHRHRRRSLPQLRHQDRWHARLLGRQLLRPGESAHRHLRGRRRRWLPRVRNQDERHRRLLGQQRRRPVDPAAAPSPPCAGGFHSCAITTDGTLACWGNNGRPVDSASGHLPRAQRRDPSRLWGSDRRHRSPAGAPTPPVRQQVPSVFG